MRWRSSEIACTQEVLAAVIPAGHELMEHGLRKADATDGPQAGYVLDHDKAGPKLTGQTCHLEV